VSPDARLPAAPAPADRAFEAPTPQAAEAEQHHPDSQAFDQGQLSLLQALFEYEPDAGLIRFAAPDAAARLFGRTAPVISCTDKDLIARIDEGEPQKRGEVFRGDAESYSCEYVLRRDDGSSSWVEERGGWIGLGPGRRLIGIIRSIDGQKRREERLAWLAENDELTGLLNRPYLRKRVEDWIGAARHAPRSGAYLLAGIDDLGAVNNDFGFEVADEVIVEIGQRLACVIGPNDLIGRVAGTKFGILIDEAEPMAVREVCNKLMNVVRARVIDTKRGGIAASICIGAVQLPDDAQSSAAAMARAEAALDQAKRQGKSSWAAFSETTDTVTTRRRNTHMSDVILTALNERRVRLAFQPIVADIGDVPSKFECLIRMRGDEGREIPAPEFIPAAERLGLVHLLDRRVLELAVNTLAICPHVRLAVNVSMETVKDPVWAEGYLAHLRNNAHLARRVTVELTETQVIDAIEASIEFVSELKKLGASFAIDDFGAGYTSFRNLKALAIDTLKIDGSFVTGVAASRENQLFVRTLLDLARNFGMKTVAEWVDNEADAMLLKGLGVDYLQGYLIGKPETQPAWLPSGAPHQAQIVPLRG
jgi:diguanylate cyclase (GGDEF)-like protein